MSTKTTAKKTTAKKTAAKTKTEASTPATTKSPAKTTPTPTETPTKVTAKTYREVSEFSPALKATKSLAKGNHDLFSAVQLITHLAWKTPGGSVGWAKGTTASVMAYAEEILVPTGTPIPEAMSAALSAATKAAADKPQKDAVAVLAKVINSHK